MVRGTSSIQILVGCPFLAWSATNTPVTINNGNDVNFSSAGSTSYSINLFTSIPSQGVHATFNGRLQDMNPPAGYPAYVARFQNSTNAGVNDLIAPVLTFNNAYTGSTSGNAPYPMVYPNPVDGFLNPAYPVTSNPPNYLEGIFVLDPVTYPDGLNGFSFFIYDIDSTPTKGWQDAVIVWGTDVNNNMVAPITQYSAITTIYDVPVPSPSNYTVNIGGNNPSLTYPNNLVNYDEDDPRGRVTYLFPTPITSIGIRYFRNSQINSQHYVWLSNLYRGCGTDLKLSLEVENPEQCEQCFTYTVVAQNNGPSDVGLAQVIDVLPAGLTFNSATATKGTFDSSTGAWTIGSLTATPMETESLYVNVCATDSSISFSMVLYGDGDQTVPGDNIVTENVIVTYIVVEDAFAITGAETPVNINWAANDYSIGGTLNLNSFSFTPPSPTEGMVTVPSPGSGFCTFTPNPDFSGTALIPYTVSDSNGCTGSATIHVMINGAPIARDDSATTIPDRLVTIDVAANDTYAVDSIFTLSTAPANGVADVNTTGTAVTYTPNPGFCGVDTFTYTITQPDSQTATATVTVTVICPPIAVPDFASTPENTPVPINIAANDTYLPGSVFSLLTNPSNGMAVVNSNGTSTYTPNNGFCGVDTYTYLITQQPDTDYTQTSSTTVTVDVVCGTPPQAYNDSATTLVNTPVTVPVLLNDIAGSYPLNPASVTIVTQPMYGTITGIDPVTGNVTYLPNPFYVGPDTFTYQVCDTSPTPQCTTAIAYITVLPLNIPCPTVCSTDCCNNPCLDEVNECMCTAKSFANFTPVDGTWTQVGSVVNTVAPLSTSNFLKYNSSVAQAQEELQVQIQFPAGQLLNQYISAGVVTDWNGSNETNQRVAYITFDNRTGTPVDSRLAIGGLDSSEVVFDLPFQIVLGQTYTMRLEKNLLQTNVYIDNTFIGSSSTGSVTGNYIGMFAFQAIADFSNLTSCSYNLTAPNFVADPT